MNLYTKILENKWAIKEAIITIIECIVFVLLGYYGTDYVLWHYTNTEIENIVVLNWEENAPVINLQMKIIEKWDEVKTTALKDIMEVKEDKKWEQQLTYNTLTFKDKTFLMSKDPKAFDDWLLSVVPHWEITYVYWHNDYRKVNNPWFYIYQNIKKWDVINIDWKKYEMIFSRDVKTKWKTDDEITVPWFVKIALFTCKIWDISQRRVFFFKDITNT